MPEIPDNYMRAMVCRVVSPYSPDFEDALQEARLARWQYRDHPKSYQVNQIVWRCTDMLRRLNGRRHPKPHIGAISLDAPAPSTLALLSPDPFVEVIEDARLGTRVDCVETILDLERALRYETERDIDWLTRNSLGETMVSIAESVGCSESWVALVLRAVRARLREATAVA